MKQILKQFTPLLIVFTILLSSTFVDAGSWLAPSGTPSADNNAPKPINVSKKNQLKRGDITALKLKAGSQVWSPEYCDENGANCFTATDVQPTGAYRTYEFSESEIHNAIEPLLTNIDPYLGAWRVQEDAPQRGALCNVLAKGSNARYISHTVTQFYSPRDNGAVIFDGTDWTVNPITVNNFFTTITCEIQEPG